MVAIVIVSHSRQVADGALELARQMAPEVPMAAAGGLPDGGIGTDFDRISQAIASVKDADGIAVLFDMGSAIMTTEMVLEQYGDLDIRMADGPVVEGTVAAAVSSSIGQTLDEVLRVVRQAGQGRKL